ncbi:hypothetical protein [Salinispora fenicalii]|uniref:hypothetical protein n=1 Tax=Salinispora fenicalii TaxID=1137263 RepID=UPI000487A550|nr:hypothetical protein [Salinispora fenicalii]
MDDTLVDTKTSLAHGVRVGSQLAAHEFAWSPLASVEGDCVGGAVDERGRHGLHRVADVGELTWADRAQRVPDGGVHRDRVVPGAGADHRLGLAGAAVEVLHPAWVVVVDLAGGLSENLLAAGCLVGRSERPFVARRALTDLNGGRAEDVIEAVQRGEGLVSTSAGEMRWEKLCRTSG